MNLYEELFMLHQSGNGSIRFNTTAYSSKIPYIFRGEQHLHNVIFWSKSFGTKQSEDPESNVLNQRFMDTSVASSTAVETGEDVKTIASKVTRYRSAAKRVKLA